MIDLHSHLVWAYDDGAVDVAESIAMARMYVDDGVEVVAATPHVTAFGWMEPPTDLPERCASLGERLSLNIVPGAEIYLTDDTAARLADQRDGHRPLGDSRYLLVEFSLGGSPDAAFRPLADLIAAGWRPILAHAERYGSLQRRPERLRELIEMGVLVQVTSGSLTGEFGPGARKLGERLVCAGLCTVLATDAHHAWRRRPILSEGRACVAELAGWDVADSLTCGNPAAILADREITLDGDLSALDSPQQSFLGALLG